MERMSKRGGCQCGRIRFQAAVDPDGAYLCHCRMCQRATGAPVVAWLTVRRAAFAWIEGEPAVYRSSPKAERLFCRRCGAQLVFREIAEPDHLDVTIASLDKPEALPPGHHGWTASRIAWFDSADDLPRYPEHGPSASS